MNNEIAINPEEIRNLSDGSVTDPETIRQIALYSIKTGDSSLESKIKDGFEFYGLYPHIQTVFTDFANVRPLIERYSTKQINESYYGKIIIKGCDHKNETITTGIDVIDKILENGITPSALIKTGKTNFINDLNNEFLKQKEAQEAINKVFTLRNQGVNYGGTILTDENRSLIPMEAHNWVVASGIDGYIAGYNAAMEELNIK